MSILEMFLQPGGCVAYNLFSQLGVQGFVHLVRVGRWVKGNEDT